MFVSCGVLWTGRDITFQLLDFRGGWMFWDVCDAWDADK